MIRLKFLASVIFLLVILAISGYGQSTEPRLMKAAREEFEALRYVSAINKIQALLKQYPDNTDAQEMLAYSYRQIRNYKGALREYERLTQLPSLKTKWILHYAELLANDEQYEKSEQWYRRYYALTPADKRASAIINAGFSSITENNGLWKAAYTNLNSGAAEYSPAYYKGGLLFSSNRLRGGLRVRHIFPWDNTPYTDLYLLENLKDIRISDADSLLKVRTDRNNNYIYNSDDTEPTSNDSRTLANLDPAFLRDPFEASIPAAKNVGVLRGRVNSRYHEGASAVFPDGSVLFTRNNFIRGKAGKSREGINKLKLYIASGKNLDRITEFSYNNDNYSVGHPALSADGSILIFASDMPGGFGGTDLYYCVRSGAGDWTRPLNLGKEINTEGDEQFPSLTQEGVLFFASNGHPGLGGLDIFEVALKEMKALYRPRNMGSPINTSKDDFGLIRNAGGKEGFFSSNRLGNDNIYHFSQATHSIVLEGTVRDANTRLPLRGSRIILKSQGRPDTILTDASASFRKVLRKETDYELVAQKSGYVSQMGFASSVGIVKDTVIKMDIWLNKPANPQQYVLQNCDSLKRVFAVDNIYYDLDRAEIRSDARPALAALVRLMKQYPDITVITSSHCDSRASVEYNRDLSMRRGEAAKRFLMSQGISSRRIRVEYYGKARLVNRCYDGVPCSEEDQQLNRRTEFDIVLNGINLTQLDCSQD